MVPARRAAPRSLPGRRLDGAERPPAHLAPGDGVPPPRRSHARGTRGWHGAREPRRPPGARRGRGPGDRRHDLPERPARRAGVQAVGEGEHVPPVARGPRERVALLGDRLQERRREGGPRRLPREARPGLARAVTRTATARPSSPAPTRADRSPETSLGTPA